MSTRSDRRRGVTLLELLAVVTLMGIFASVVTMRYGRTLFAEFGSRSVARQLSLDLLTCQRASICTGDDHFLQFSLSGGRAVDYRLMRDTGSGAVLVDGPRVVSSDITVTVSHTELRYHFDGTAAANYWIRLVGQNHVWRVDVVPISGAVRVTDTS